MSFPFFVAGQAVPVPPLLLLEIHQRRSQRTGLFFMLLELECQGGALFTQLLQQNGNLFPGCIDPGQGFLKSGGFTLLLCLLLQRLNQVCRDLFQVFLQRLLLLLQRV